MAPPVDDALLLLNVVFLSATLPLSVIAVIGYRGTPWGQVVLFLPFISVGYVVTQGLALSPLEGPGPFYVGLFTLVVAVVATALLAYRLATLLTGRRAV